MGQRCGVHVRCLVLSDITLGLASQYPNHAAAVGLQGDSGSQRVKKQTDKKTDRVLASKPVVTTTEEYKMVRTHTKWVRFSDGNAEETAHR
jgi:hypothetical protein